MKDKLKEKILRFGFGILFVLLSSFSIFAQGERVVKGIVADSKNEPIIGASVILKGNPTVGTATDTDGNFTLSIPAGNQTLVVSYLGMQTKEVNVGASNDVNVVLQDDQVALKEVVIVGFGQQKKESVIGAITQTTAKTLERTGGVSDLGMALTGNLPGVTTMSTTGMPGEEDPSIVIRGRGSWNNTDPLILVDGIERPMNSVDINSVESISVLKDASATAVFGVRGANGVILITTKRGQEGKATINFNFSSALKSPSRIPQKYDSYDALLYLDQAIENELGVRPESWGGMYPYEVIQKFRNPVDQAQAERYPNIDWQKETMKDYAMAYNANMNIAGGTKFVKYFANVDYQQEGDIYREIDNNRGYTAGYGYNRLNVRSNLDFSITPSTTLKVGLSGSTGVKKGPVSEIVNPYTAWTAVYVTAPDAMMPRYSDGSWGFHAPAYTDGSQLNPLSNMALRGIEYTTTNRINTDFTAEQDLGKLLKGLKAHATLAFDNQYLENRRGVNDLYKSDYQMKYIDPRSGAVTYLYDIDATNKFDFHEAVNWDSRAGTIVTDNTVTGVYRKLYYLGQIDYANTFAQKHNLTLMANFSREERATGNIQPIHREDWVFRGTYDYDRKYLLEYNGSYDGSDIFAPENRFVYFQSGALGWLVTEESFIKNLNLNWLDMFKLRASYGKIGDDQLPEGAGRYPYMTSWDINDNMGFRQSLYGENTTTVYPVYYQSNVANPDIHWETVTKTNFGIDYSFLKNLAAGSFDIFKDQRRDIFIWGTDRAMSSYFGSAPPNANLGAVDVKGFEVELRLNKSLNKDLKLWANFSFTHVKDKVLKSDDSELLAAYRKKAGYAVGQPKYYVNTGYINNMDELYGSAAHDVLDIMRTPGGYTLLDYDADGVISANDLIPYSYSRTPQNTFNTSFGIDWKGWSFFMQWYGVNNVTREAVYTSLEHATRHTVYEYQGSYWTRDIQNADWPKLVFSAKQSDYSTGTRYDFDASYLRLKNVELSYTFTDDQRWVRKTGIKNLKLYVNGDNLWLYTKMPDDRETNNNTASYQSAYPTMRRINFGLRVSL